MVKVSQNTRPEYAGQDEQTPERVGGPLVDLFGPADLSHAGLHDRGADHAADPFVATGGNCQQSVIVLAQELINGLPFFGRQVNSAWYG